MAAFADSSEVVGQVKDVCDLAWGQSQACNIAGPGFQGLCNDIRNLHCELRALGENLANPKSFLKRCGHPAEVELRELIEECKDDLQEVEGFLNGLSPSRRNSITPRDQEVQGLCKKTCDRTAGFKEFQAQATSTGLGHMKAQLSILVEDIVSGRRQPHILTKVVDWEALTTELNQAVDADPIALEMNDEEAESFNARVVELPESPRSNSHSPSPERPSTEDPTQSRRVRYRQPTVEDWVEGDDDELLSPTTLPMSSTSSDPAADPHSNEVNPEPSQNSRHGLSEDPLADPSRKPRRVDTEIRIVQEEKLTIEEQIRKLKEAAKRLEEENLIQEFHNFCANVTEAQEESILAESWRLPLRSSNNVVYFVMPSGATYNSQALKRDSQSHPVPPLPNAVRRGSSYASHTSSGGSGGGSTGGSAGIASPLRNDSAIFGGRNNQPRRMGSSDLFSAPLPRTPGVGASDSDAADGRHGRWWTPIAESPREMSPVSNERTPTPSQPPPSIPRQHSPPLTPRPAHIIEHPFPVTLEEIFHGTERTVRVDREVFDPRTRSMRKEPKMLTVPVKRGLKAGSKIKFSGAGNTGPDGVAQDIWFVIQDKRHQIFKRVGSDLHITLDLTDVEAMYGWRKEIWTICDRRFRVKGPENTPTEWSRTLRGFGMPMSKDPSERGDLIIHVDIPVAKYPSPFGP